MKLSRLFLVLVAFATCQVSFAIESVSCHPKIDFQGSANGVVLTGAGNQFSGKVTTGSAMMVHSIKTQSFDKITLKESPDLSVETYRGQGFLLIVRIGDQVTGQLRATIAGEAKPVIFNNLICNVSSGIVPHPGVSGSSGRAPSPDQDE